MPLSHGLKHVKCFVSGLKIYRWRFISRAGCDVEMLRSKVRYRGMIGGAAATLIVAPADVNRRVRRVCTRNSLYIQVVRSFVSIEPKMVRTRSVHYPVKYHSHLKLLVDPSRSHCYFISMQNRRASFLLYHKSTGVLRRRHLEVER